MDVIYKSQIYDDFHHLMKHHQSEIQSIKDVAISQCKMPECNLSQCNYSDRYFGIRQKQLNITLSINTQWMHCIFMFASYTMED